MQVARLRHGQPRGSRALAALFLAVGCVRGYTPSPAVDSQDDLIATFRGRAYPEQGVARVQVQLETSERSVTLPGAFVLDRPARGHFALLGPLGGPLATVQTDGQAVSVVLSRGNEHYLGAHADTVVRDATGGALGVTDLFGLLIGDPPFEGAEERGRRMLADGAVELTLEGPHDLVVTEVVANPAGTLTRLLVSDGEGHVPLRVSYAPFAPIETVDGVPGLLVPTELTIEIPDLELVATIRVKSWVQPDVLPDVFGLEAPPGFSTYPLETLVDPLATLQGAVPEP